MSSVVKVKKIKDEKKDETKNIDIEAEPEKVIKKVKKIKEPILDTHSVEKEIEPEIEIQEEEKPKKSKKVKEVKDKEIIPEDGEKGGYDATEKGTDEELKTKGKIKKTKENYLVDAMSVTEAEARVVKLFVDSAINVDYEVTGAKESKIIEVVNAE